MVCASTLSAAVCTAMDRLPGDAAPLGRRHEEAQEEEDRAVQRGPRNASRPASCHRASADPPTPERKQMKRVRLPQSPGMKKVKAAAYVARKAALVAKKAWKMFEKKSELSDREDQHQGHLGTRIWAIERAGVEEGGEVGQHQVHPEGQQGGAADQRCGDIRPP